MSGFRYACRFNPPVTEKTVQVDNIPETVPLVPATAAPVRPFQPIVLPASRSDMLSLVMFGLIIVLFIVTIHLHQRVATLPTLVDFIMSRTDIGFR